MGIIPAYAGSTISTRPETRPPPDHPRIRGEHIVGSIGMVIGWGSSPHTRGARESLHQGDSLSRIIPAYAGSTTDSDCHCGARRDHPRIRGEHIRVAAGWLGSAGSSPHTRGALQARAPRAARTRIIPAYAGSTTCSCGRCSATTDHPRIRGEHPGGHFHVLWRRGSSPHTRGALGDGQGVVGDGRIIPAYAGSTAPGGRPAATTQDHPRIRGEHSGSRRPGGVLRRIIPAYAGSTRECLCLSISSRDHPRIRGEHPAPHPSATRPSGSSPHTRGALSYSPPKS